METQGRLIEFWLVGAKRCVLCSVDHELEVRLYDRGLLVGLEPCRTSREGLDIAKRWRTKPPLWPPF
jgi:hypothetical protein